MSSNLQNEIFCRVLFPQDKILSCILCYVLCANDTAKGNFLGVCRLTPDSQKACVLY